MVYSVITANGKQRQKDLSSRPAGTTQGDHLQKQNLLWDKHNEEMNSGSLRKSSYLCRSARPDSICLLPQPYEMGRVRNLKHSLRRKARREKKGMLCPRQIGATLPTKSTFLPLLQNESGSEDTTSFISKPDFWR